MGSENDTLILPALRSKSKLSKVGGVLSSITVVAGRALSDDISVMLLLTKAVSATVLDNTVINVLSVSLPNGEDLMASISSLDRSIVSMFPKPSFVLLPISETMIVPLADMSSVLCRVTPSGLKDEKSTAFENVKTSWSELRSRVKDVRLVEVSSLS